MERGEGGERRGERERGEGEEKRKTIFIPAWLLTFLPSDHRAMCVATQVTSTQLTLGLIMMGARGSLTSLTFRFEVVTAATGDTVPTASGDCSGGAGEVLAGRGEPPIKSLTSLFTSSLSLDSGSGDFVRP